MSGNCSFWAKGDALLLTLWLPVGKRLEQTLLQGGHTEGPETQEKMLSIASHQRHAN